ncbi:MAG: 16S rRNA (cytosine(1402)-N(4))-methyltransferase RsmH [Acidimicrobiia bacterium]|nr:16S rRNA (cytosine(1402)-N(4))-methyltransferase RsmH [Acidimicrobiia bacterium]
MNQTPSPGHQPVMPEEVVEAFQTIPNGTIVDATYGGGGHSRLLLAAGGPERRILAIDQDPAVRDPVNRMDEPDQAVDRLTLVTDNFRRLRQIAEELSLDAIVGILFDLGFSSLQMDDPARGFSYRSEGPLDMRLGRPTHPDASSSEHRRGGAGAAHGWRTAAEIVNEADVGELTRIIDRYGEEPMAGRVARAIVKSRPIATTTELASIISDAIPAALKRTRHPARRTFQALRIAVNDELEALSEGLDAGLDLLAPGGRIAVLSYHSLEDRIVKRAFRKRSEPDDGLMPVVSVEPSFREINRRPLRPGDDEIASNPRARSARLRVAERL